VTTNDGSSFPEVGEWAGQAEIAYLLGVSRQRVQQLVARPDFPKPDIELSMGRIWRTARVREWAAQHGRDLNE